MRTTTITYILQRFTTTIVPVIHYYAYAEKRVSNSKRKDKKTSGIKHQSSHTSRTWTTGLDRLTNTNRYNSYNRLLQISLTDPKPVSLF